MRRAQGYKSMHPADQAQSRFGYWRDRVLIVLVFAWIAYLADGFAAELCR
ncbi:MAG: hypothetical protein ACRBC3_19815 [Burkholderiaceae bacterium]